MTLAGILGECDPAKALAPERRRHARVLARVEGFMIVDGWLMGYRSASVGGQMAAFIRACRADT